MTGGFVMPGPKKDLGLAAPFKARTQAGVSFL